jgi:hypothetical protein
MGTTETMTNRNLSWVATPQAAGDFSPQVPCGLLLTTGQQPKPTTNNDLETPSNSGHKTVQTSGSTLGDYRHP